jgi:hypothetical protein
MDYLLKTTAVLIGNNRGSINRFDKEGSSLYSFRRSADFCLEEKSAWVISVYKQKILTNLVSPKVKMAHRGRNIKGTMLQGQKKEGFCRLDYQHVFA